jgi:predicted transcriptional regulator of viral defense system
MKKIDALKTLQSLDRRGVYVLTKGDLAKAFPGEQAKALEKSLERLVTDGILERVTKGVYLNPMALSKKNHVIEDIAAVLRRSHLSYLSLESMLSEYGVISQVPVRRLTIMTTGAKGVYATAYGTIEFTHTKRRPTEIIRRTLTASGRPLRIALKAAAVQDLVRVGRNTDMMDMAEID